MRAEFILDGAHHNVPLDPAVLRKAVQAEGIPVTSAIEERLIRICQIKNRLAVDTTELLAEGRLPTEPTRPTAQVLLSDSSVTELGSFAKNGDAIAVVTLGTPGLDGANVLGEIAPANPVPKPEALLGQHTALSHDEKRIIAQLDGIIHHDNGVYSIAPLLKFSGDIPPEHPTISFDGDMLVEGSIRAQHKIKCAGNVHVAGTIESAGVVCMELTALGGILADSSANGPIRTKLIRDCTVTSTRSIIIDSDVQNARVVSGETIRADGFITASHLTSLSFVKCRELGSTKQEKTLVEIGIDETLRRLGQEHLPAIEDLRARARRAKIALDPLLLDRKRLTRAQKERCTELMYEMEACISSATNIENHLVNAYESTVARSKTELNVSNHVHPGVTIRFPGVETTLRMTIEDPVQFTYEYNAGRATIVCKQTSNGKTIPLETKKVPDPILEVRQHIESLKKSKMAA